LISTSGLQAPEIAQQGSGELHCKTCRKLHPQRAQRRGRSLADFLERVLDAIKGLGDGGQEVLAGPGQRQGVRLAL